MTAHSRTAAIVFAAIVLCAIAAALYIYRRAPKVLLNAPVADKTRVILKADFPKEIGLQPDRSILLKRLPREPVRGKEYCNVWGRAELLTLDGEAKPVLEAEEPVFCVAE